MRITGEKLVQVEPVSSAGGRGNKGGLRAAESELGIDVGLLLVAPLWVALAAVIWVVVRLLSA